MFLAGMCIYDLHNSQAKYMSEENSSITTLSTICVILLREYRYERGIHQAQVADWIGKTPSAWTKIEAGKSPLQFDTFVRVATCMGTSASAVLAAAERYAALFSNNRWAVVTTDLPAEEDALLRLSQEYWGSPGFRARGGIISRSILSGPTFSYTGRLESAAVFEFALDPQFRESQLTPIALELGQSVPFKI